MGVAFDGAVDVVPGATVPVDAATVGGATVDAEVGTLVVGGDVEAGGAEVAVGMLVGCGVDDGVCIGVGMGVGSGSPPIRSRAREKSGALP